MNIEKAKNQQYARQCLIDRAEATISGLEELESVGVCHNIVVDLDFDTDSLAITLTHSNRITMTVSKNDPININGKQTVLKKN